jgi:hypothetical protein
LSSTITAGEVLGHAIALLQRHAAPFPHLSSGTGIGAPPTPPIDEPAEVGVAKGRMLRHELVDRGHAEEHVDATGGIADQLQRLAGIEGAHDQHGAAGMQHRIGVAIQSAGVEQRQHREQHRRGEM